MNIWFIFSLYRYALFMFSLYHYTLCLSLHLPICVFFTLPIHYFHFFTLSINFAHFLTLSIHYVYFFTLPIYFFIFSFNQYTLLVYLFPHFTKTLCCLFSHFTNALCLFLHFTNTLFSFYHFFFFSPYQYTFLFFHFTNTLYKKKITLLIAIHFFHFANKLMPTIQHNTWTHQSHSEWCRALRRIPYSWISALEMNICLFPHFTNTLCLFLSLPIHFVCAFILPKHFLFFHFTNTLWILQSTLFNPLRPHDALKHHFTSLKTDLIFLQQKGFKTKMSMKLVYKSMAIFFTFPPISSHLYPLQVENCDSDSRLVVDEDDNGKFRF